MQVAVVLVKPEYAMNIGYVARAMRNFGRKELVLVNPLADHLSGDARSRAMKGAPLLKKAKIFSSLEEALAPYDYAIATSARLSSPLKLSRSALTPKELAERYSPTSSRIALVFGNEKNGLTNAELKQCDCMVHIPAYTKYRTLTLSHAAAILLYELSSFPKSGVKKVASPHTRKKLRACFGQMARNTKGIKNPDAAIASFRALLAKNPVSEKEARALLAVFSNARKFSSQNSTNK